MSVPTLDNVDRPRAFGYGVSLGDRLFRLAVGPGRQLEIVTAPLEAPRVNTTSSPEEAAAEFGLTFARSAFDGGEGLFRAHAEGAAPNRFWDSKGVDVSVPEPGEFPQIRLLHKTARSLATTNTGLRMAYDDLAGRLYVCDGNTLRYTDNPFTASPTWTADSPAVSPEVLTSVHDVAVLGSVVYAACGAAGGINRKVAGVWENWSDTPATRIWAVKGRIVATAGASLYEVVAPGATPTAKVILATGEEWRACCDGGSHILAGASDGYVYAFDTDTGSLVLTSQTLFESEQIRSLGSSQGVVAVGTSQGNIGRLYVGGLEQAGQVIEQQLIRQWGSAGSVTAQYPTRILGTRSSLYAGVTDGTDTCLWRYDLVTGGISRNLCVDAVTGMVRGVESIDGRLVFSVDGSGVHAEQSTYVNEGWLIGPLGDFYTSQEKSWVGARLDTSMIEGGATAQLLATASPAALADHASPEWSSVTTRDSGSGDSGEMPMVAVVARHLAGQVRLTPSADNATSPAVFSFSFRAYPSSGDEDRIISLPINVSDQIERRGRRRVRVKGRGETEYAALRSLEGRPVVMRLFKPELFIRGLVEEVATPVLAIPNRGSATMVSQVRIRGQVVGLNVTSGAGAWGTDIAYATSFAYGDSA